uniref:Odorant-binding protein 19a1 n=1 Tax=Bactrocera minax TaxID=104690 RepID=A0A3G2LEF2_9MUSC|nr:odorant-binding protein 19a1 [Bactrocera minax]
MLNKINPFILTAVFIALVLHSDQVSGGATEDQMISAGKLMRDVCLPKFNKMKKGKFLYESSLKQVDLLMPDSYKDDYRNGLGKCKDVANGIKNNCDASYAVLICLRDNISKFVFP